MPEHLPHVRPVLVFDGECRFCRAWVGRWKLLTGDRIDYVAYQETDGRFAGFPQETFATSVHLMLPDGTALRGAHAVFSALALGADRRAMLWTYEHVPGFAWICESIYGWIAAHREFGYWVTKKLGISR